MRSFARIVLFALAASACQPPAPAVDEERLARRVAELLADRYAEDGICRARTDEGDERSASDGSSEDSQLEQRQQAALARMRAQLADLAAAAQNAVPEPPLPVVQLSPEQRAVSTGTGEHARVCFPLPPNTPSIGPDNAAVTIVAFLDPECPFCARLYPSLLRAQSAYAQDVRLSVALHPLNFHRSAPRASMALREAFAQRQSQGFFSYFSRVYSDIRDLSPATLSSYAEELNMDSARFREAIDDARHANAVATTVALAESASVNSSPQFFVNGRRMQGAVSEETLGGVLFEELERARRLQRSTPAARLQAALCRADASSTRPEPARPRPLPGSTNGDRP